MSPKNESYIEILDDIEGFEEMGMLQELLKTVMTNRRAMGILKALEEGDSEKAKDIAKEAKKEGLQVADIKAACKAFSEKS